MTRKINEQQQKPSENLENQSMSQTPNNQLIKKKKIN